MTESDVNKVIEQFSQLPVEDKVYVAGVIEKQLVEAKRERLVERAREARMHLEHGEVKTGTVRDLMEDLTERSTGLMGLQSFSASLGAL